MKQRTSKRFPWEKDPNDREANYKRPVPQHEKVRLTAKVASVVAGFAFIRLMTEDRSDVGAEFLIGFGAPLLVAGMLDLVWTLQGKLEHIFVESRPLQLVLHGGMATIGLAMLVAGAMAKGT